MADVTISTIQDLVSFSNGDYGRGTSSAYLDVVLTADLDFADLNEYENPYNWAGCTGTWYVNFDGQGHKIDNIYYAGSGTWALFGAFYGSIKNLKLTNVFVTAQGNIAAFVLTGYDGLRIENCAFSGHLESLGGEAAGYVNYPDGNNAGPRYIINCSYSGVLKTNGSNKSANPWFGNGYRGGYVIGCLFVGDSISVALNASCFGCCASIINCEFRGTVQAGNGLYYRSYQGILYNCIAIVGQGSRCSRYDGSGSSTNSYYDSDKASEAGLTGIGLTPATTAELQDAQWLHDHGFAI
jgi:hypothetical protein